MIYKLKKIFLELIIVISITLGVFFVSDKEKTIENYILFLIPFLIVILLSFIINLIIININDTWFSIILYDKEYLKIKKDGFYWLNNNQMEKIETNELFKLVMYDLFHNITYGTPINYSMVDEETYSKYYELISGIRDKKFENDKKTIITLLNNALESINGPYLRENDVVINDALKVISVKIPYEKNEKNGKISI